MSRASGPKRSGARRFLADDGRWAPDLLGDFWAQHKGAICVRGPWTIVARSLCAVVSLSS